MYRNIVKYTTQSVYHAPPILSKLFIAPTHHGTSVFLGGIRIGRAGGGAPCGFSPTRGFPLTYSSNSLSFFGTNSEPFINQGHFICRLYAVSNLGKLRKGLVDFCAVPAFLFVQLLQCRFRLRSVTVIFKIIAFYGSRDVGTDKN